MYASTWSSHGLGLSRTSKRSWCASKLQLAMWFHIIDILHLAAGQEGLPRLRSLHACRREILDSEKTGGAESHHSV